MKSRSSTITYFAFNFIHAFVLWMILAYLPIYLKELHIPDEGIGVLLSVFFVTTLLVAAPFGYLSDKISPRRLVRFGASLFCISLIGLCLIKSFAGIFLLLLAGGAGSAIFLICVYSLYYKRLSPEDRGRQLGTFFVAAYLGYSFGPLAGGYLLAHFEMQALFGLGIILLAILVVLSKALEDTDSIRFAARDYRQDLVRREVLFLISIVLIMGVHFGAERTCFSLFLKENVKLTSRQIGQIFFCVGIWLGAITYVSRHIFNGHRNVIALASIGLFVSGLFQSLTSKATSFQFVLPVRLFHTAGDSFVILAQGVMVSLAFPRHRFGGNYGFVRMVTATGIFLGAIISGFLARKFGYGNPLISSGVLLMALSIFLWRKRQFVDQLFKSCQAQDRLNQAVYPVR